jgi:hypothetical protein
MSVSIATLGKFTPASGSGGGGGVPYPVEVEKPKPIMLADLVRINTLGDFSVDTGGMVKVKSVTMKSEDCKIGIISVRTTQ